MRFPLLLCLHLFLPPSWGTEAKSPTLRKIVESGEIILSQKSPRPWERGDPVCFHRGRQIIACAEVFRVGADEVAADPFWKSGIAIRMDDEVREAPGRGRILSFNEAEGLATISQPKAVPWKVGENVFVVRHGDILAWGHVMEGSVLTAKIRVLGRREPFDEGDWVRPAPKVEGHQETEAVRVPISIISDLRPPTIERSNLVSLGVLGPSPAVRYERIVLNRFGIAVLPVLFSASQGETSLAGPGFMLALSYYPATYLKGIWFQMMAGLLKLALSQGGASEGIVSPTFATTMGYRWLSDSGFSFGVGAGAFSVVQTQSAARAIQITGLFPTLTIDLGFMF